MPSIKEALKISSHFIPYNEAVILLEYAMKLNQIILQDPNKLLLKKEFSTFIDCVKRRVRHEPIAYIVEKKEFFGLEFYVKKGVLIPRPETEILVERAIELVRQTFSTNVRIIDLCTGSGAIILSIAQTLQNGTFIGIDVSNIALKIANKNKKNFNLQNVKFIQKDIFSLSTEYCQADILISNPPYISSKSIENLMPDVKNFEPNLALDGGKDGIDFYKQIARIGKNTKYILLEIGIGMEKDVIKIFSSENYIFQFSVQDFANITRVLCFKA